MVLTDFITIASTTFIGVIAVLVSLYFAKATKKREDDIFQKDLFKEFNLLEILITSFHLVLYAIIHLYNSLGKPGKYMYINA